MNRTHVVPNMYVPAVVFESMTIKHARTTHTRESLHGGTWKNWFVKLGYTSSCPFQKPEC